MSNIIQIPKMDIDSLPIFERPQNQSVIVITSLEQCNQYKKELYNAKVLGFDTETEVSFIKGQPAAIGPDVLQLATNTTVYIFQVSQAENDLLNFLKPILENDKQIKVGFDLRQDIKHLGIKGIQLRGAIDCAFGWGSKTLGLRVAAAFILKLQLKKVRNVTTSRWKSPLKPKQINYAATDASAALIVFQQMFLTNQLSEIKITPEQYKIVQTAFTSSTAKPSSSTTTTKPTTTKPTTTKPQRKKSISEKDDRWFMVRTNENDTYEPYNQQVSKQSHSPATIARLLSVETIAFAQRMKGVITHIPTKGYPTFNQFHDQLWAKINAKSNELATKLLGNQTYDVNTKGAVFDGHGVLLTQCLRTVAKNRWLTATQQPNSMDLMKVIYILQNDPNFKLPGPLAQIWKALGTQHVWAFTTILAEFDALLNSLEVFYVISIPQRFFTIKRRAQAVLDTPDMYTHKLTNREKSTISTWAQSVVSKDRK